MPQCVIDPKSGSNSYPTGEDADDELKRNFLCFLNLPADPIAESSNPVTSPLSGIVFSP